MPISSLLLPIEAGRPKLSGVRLLARPLQCVDNNEGLLLLAYRGSPGMPQVYPHTPQPGGDPMRFYTIQHPFDGGIDLPVDWRYLCVMDANGEVRGHQNIRTDPQAFLPAVKPFREDVVVGVEYTFTWYWLADLCEDEGIPFVLGHALSMRAIHGGNAKNDRIDSQKIAPRAISCAAEITSCASGRSCTRIFRTLPVSITSANPWAASPRLRTAVAFWSASITAAWRNTWRWTWR